MFKVLFVGGPWDGKFMVIPEILEIYKIMVISKIDYTRSPQEVTPEVETYYHNDLVIDRNKPPAFDFYFYSDLSQFEAYAQIFNHYSLRWEG